MGDEKRELHEILESWNDLLGPEPGEDFSGETFRGLKQKDENKFGDYRTRRLVLEAWARQQQ